MSVSFFVGLDLGQAQDPSALAAIEKTRPGSAPATYDVRELRRWPLGTGFPEIVEEVVGLFASPPLAGGMLVVDATGCGRPCVDLFRRARPAATLRPVLITAGQATRWDEWGYYHVAKVQLAGCLRALLGERRLRFARQLPLAKTVEKELQTFKARITPAGSEQFLADWREGQHDDLALAVAIGCYAGENLAQRLNVSC